jgi:hypothetical protein
MPQGGGIWIHSGASARIANSDEVTLGFHAEALPRFANVDDARRCAEEIVALLRRFGLKAEIRQD